MLFYKNVIYLFFERNKFKIKKQQQHICNKIFTKNKYQKYEMTDYQLKKILRNQNLIINESIHDINLPLLQTYIAKGNRGNLYFFITSSNRRISTQQALKKLSKLNNKFKLRFIKKKKNQTLVSDVNFSPLLLVIFKKRDLRCSWSIFDSHLLNKNVLVPSLTKNIFLELNYSSLIQFMTDHVKHVTYMNFPQQHF